MLSFLFSRLDKTIESGDPKYDLYRAVQHHFPDLRNVRCILNKADSFFLSAAYADGRRVFLKCVDTKQGYERLKGEFNAAMSYLGRMSRSPSYSVPRPVECAEFPGGKGALVVEYVGLPRGDRWFKWFADIPPLRHAGLRRAAWWLAQFHQAGSRGEVAIEDTVDLARHKEAFLTFAAKRSALTDRVTNAIDELCSLEAADTGTEKLLTHVCQLHDDYIPANIFLTRKQVIGYDFTGTVVGVPYEDIARFLVTLVWLSRPVIRPYRPTLFARDREVFLSAYGDRQTSQSRKLLDIYVLHEVVSKDSRLTAPGKKALKQRVDAKHSRMLQAVFWATLEPYAR